MERRGSDKASFILRTGPLIIYEITFTLFVIYYVQGGMIWFKISFLSIVISALVSFIKIFLSYRQWNLLPGKNKKTGIPGLFSDFLFFALYLFCLLVQMDQWKMPFTPHFIIIPFLAAPPLIAFAFFLYTDSKNHREISK
jgi:hypothetical protein